jgi:hypothetical protein
MCSDRTMTGRAGGGSTSAADTASCCRPWRKELSRGAAHPVGVEPNEQKQAGTRARGSNVSFFDFNTHEER